MIPQIEEINFPKYATLSAATVNLADMGENTITAEVTIDGNIVPDFSYDWAVSFRGERYVHRLRKPQASIENTSFDGVYSLTFKHFAIVELQRYYFFTYAATASGTAVADKYIAPLTLNLKNFCIAFNEVLDYYFNGGITIDLNPGWKYDPEPKTIDISYSYLWDVLVKLYDLYGVRWNIVREGGNYVIKVGYDAAVVDHVFSKGFEGGLLKIERQVQDDNIRNIILGRGGEKNLPTYYFKKAPDNSTFPSDPDWVPELTNIYFDRLRDSNFRDYIKGWKTNPHRDLQGGELTVETYDADYAATHFAYELGATDEFFRPIEYVKDDDSIAQYGELWGALEDNEEAYPSIQRVSIDPIGRVDEVIAVQKIESDDIEAAVERDSKVSDVYPSSVAISVSDKTVSNGRANFRLQSSGPFSVDEGQYATLYARPFVEQIYNRATKKRLAGDNVADLAYVPSYTVHVYNIANRNEELSHIDLPYGTYDFYIEGVVENNDDGTLDTVITVSPQLMSSNKMSKWGNTFDIWIKNIWLTKKGINESEAAYVNRVWAPILGGRDGEEAKVVFSTGWLSTSEDYEFTIVKNGVHFDQKECTWTDSEGNEHTYTSEWRLTLAKSDAEYDATGLYIPNTKLNAEAGDFFFFVGVELPHQYVLWAEKDKLNASKRDELDKVADKDPTWAVDLDKVRISQQEIKADEVTTLVEQIVPGASLRLFDPWFNIIDKPYETVYVQSMTFDFKAPTDNDPALIPDVSIVLSNEWQNNASVVATLQGNIDALTKQFGALSNIEQAIRVIGDKLYLRKDGFSDISLSPTQFVSLVTSLNFRQGLIGGQGWGFFKDAQDNWSLEVDRLNVRQQMQVNELVINQISARGGMYVESAANMEVTNVVITDDGYACYFDQKGGSVANLFHVGDVALCHRFTAENGELKFYKRRVVAIGVDHIVLSDTEKNGDGIPAIGDVIVQYGSYTDPNRRYVKVRDVVGGGYERYIEGLDSVSATGTEYYFVGRQTGSYGDNPRFFIGNTDNFVEFINGELNIKGRINTLSTFGDKTLDEVFSESKAPNLMTRYSADATSWHPIYQSGDVWMQTSNDGGTTWSAAMRIQGASYTPNLVLEGNVKFAATATNYHINYYTFDGDIELKVGDKLTITACFCVGDDDSLISLEIGQGASVASLIPTEKNVEEVRTVQVTLTSVNRPKYFRALAYPWDQPPFSPNTYIKWIMVERGYTEGVEEWTPAASEMVGKDGKWRKFQWALGSETAVTGAWQDTPMNAPAGKYVWMRSGIVTPPATDPTTWETATRLTGDKGQNGDSVYMLDLSNEMMPIQCDAAGNVVGTYSTSQASVYKGGTKVTSGITYSIVQQTGVSATITSAGVVTPSNLTADRGTIVVQAVVDGVTLQTTLSLYKVKPGMDGSNYTPNLLVGTSDWSMPGIVDKNGTPVITEEAHNGNLVMSADTIYCARVFEADIEAGNDYTISVDVLSPDTAISFSLNSLGTPTSEITDATLWQPPTPGTWTRIKRTFKCTTSGTLTFYCQHNAAGVFKLAGYKLENGINANPEWSPAPSEMLAVSYSLELSANNITRNALGNLSATSITVQKYKTVGDKARELTTEKTVRYMRVGYDTDWQYRSTPEDTFVISVPTSNTLTAIVVELLDGTTTLDRERIPVITDGVIPTENLVRNSRIEKSGFVDISFTTSEKLLKNEPYTFTIWGSITDGSKFAIKGRYNFMEFELGVLEQISTGVYSAVITISPQILYNLDKFNVTCKPSALATLSTPL